MSLTTAVEKQLGNSGLIGEFDRNRKTWKDMAELAYQYTCNTVEGKPKPDDVSPHLAFALETCDAFLILKDGKKLRARKWFTYFADLIVDRTWNELIREGE